MRRILSFVVYLEIKKISILSHKRKDFWKKLPKRKMCVLISSNPSPEKFLSEEKFSEILS
jgi:hypothetical protein